MAATSLDELRLISEQLAGEHTIRSIRDRAMILFGFATAFRRIEIAGFDLSDIELKPASLAISLGKSKADQEGKGRELVIPKAKDPGLCPILALNEWLEARGRWPGPLFTDIRGKKVLKLTRNRMECSVVCYAVRAAAKRAGIAHYRKFGAHSLRAGFVTTATDAGADIFDIMAVTGHRSIDTLRKYVRRSTARYPLRAVL